LPGEDRRTGRREVLGPGDVRAEQHPQQGTQHGLAEPVAHATSRARDRPSPYGRLSALGNGLAVRRLLGAVPDDVPSTTAPLSPADVLLLMTTPPDRQGVDVPVPPGASGLLPGAEPVDLPGGPVGALLSHGVHRHDAEHAAVGRAPRRRRADRERPRLPGHGTRWQDMNATRFSDWYGEIERTFDDLRARCETVFVMGLSMGGTLALRLAELRPSEVAGLVVVNASSAPTARTPSWRRSCRRCSRRSPASAATSRSPGQGAGLRPDPAQGRRVAAEGLAGRAADLHRISCPVLVYRSRVDHVVPPVSGELLLRGLAGGTVEERVLEDSYHVATLDHDAPAIFDGSLDFVRAHTPAARAEMTDPRLLEPPSDGRRDNGLPCSDWGALVDVEPGCPTGLLASLAAAAWPPYVEPRTGRTA
jgi:carboxylesterase